MLSTCEFPTSPERPLDEWIDLVWDQRLAYGRPKQNRRELEWLLGEVNRLRPSRLLEIGSLEGGTLFLLSRVADPGALILSLDLQSCGLYWFARYGVRGTQTVHARLGNSQSGSTAHRVARLLSGQPLDFLMIDGDHRYGSVRRDFEAYARLVRPGGLVALHDIAHPIKPGMCEVEPFWQELKKRYKAREYVNPDQKPDILGIGTVEIPE